MTRRTILLLGLVSLAGSVWLLRVLDQEPELAVLALWGSVFGVPVALEELRSGRPAERSRHGALGRQAVDSDLRSRRIVVLVPVFMPVLLAAAVFDELEADGHVGSAPGDVAFWALVVLGALGTSMALAGRPRALVPPHLREDPYA